MGIRNRINKTEYSLPAYCSPQLVNLFSRIFQPDPAARADVAELLCHPWTGQALEMAEQRLAMAKLVHDRLSATAAVAPWVISDVLEKLFAPSIADVSTTNDTVLAAASSTDMEEDEDEEVMPRVDAEMARLQNLPPQSRCKTCRLRVARCARCRENDLNSAMVLASALGGPSDDEQKELGCIRVAGVDYPTCVEPDPTIAAKLQELIRPGAELFDGLHDGDIDLELDLNLDWSDGDDIDLLA